MGLEAPAPPTERRDLLREFGWLPVAAVVLAAGALPLWGAVAADMSASLVAVANGLRLLRGRPAAPRDPSLLPAVGFG